MNHPVRYKKVDPSIAHHPIEKRGFVSVPFDYGSPNDEKIDIFYRLIPAYGSTPEDASKPIIVVVNGGPGISCSFYRPLDFDYQDLNSPKNGSPNRFLYLLNSYRVLIVDQRGTDGQSVPIDLEDPCTDANFVAKHFSSDNQAKDYLAVINHLIPENEAFYMIAQSYGGIVGMQYLGLLNMRKPKGIVFSASAVPYEDVMEAMLCRREEQLRLNLHLQKIVPGIENKVAQVKAHLKSVGLSENLTHNLYALLGKGVTGVWENAFVERLDKMLTQSHDELKKELADTGGVSILNYILSSCNFTPGHTDRSIAQLASSKIPFQPWMIDENKTLNEISEEPWKEALVSKMDANPPAPTPMPSLELLRTEIGKNQLLFTAAENDAFVPADIFKKSIDKFQVPGHTQIKTIPGGHNAIFLEKGYSEFVAWAKSI